MGHAPALTRLVVLQSTDGHCWYCGKPLEIQSARSDPFDAFQVDHVVPVKRGGSDTIDNLAPSCRPRNVDKGGATLIEYRVRRYLAKNHKLSIGKLQIPALIAFCESHGIDIVAEANSFTFWAESR